MATNPITRLRLQLSPEFAPLFTFGSPFHTSLCEALRAELSELLHRLGVPGDPDVELRVDVAQSMPVRWLVHDRECPYSDELPLAVWSFLQGKLPERGADHEDQAGWVAALRSAAAASAATTQPWTEFFRLFAHAVLEVQPSVLLGAEQVEALAAQLVEDGLHEDARDVAGWLAPVLTEMLDMGLSLELQMLRNLVADRAHARAPCDLAEDLITKWTPKTLEIWGDLEQIKRFSLAATDGEKLLPLMRDGLFYELGIRYPRVRFVPMDVLPAGAFAFKIHAWETTPRVGLAPVERLVNETVERLRDLRIEGRPAINPANGNECSVINSSDAAAAEAAGLTTWNQQGYLVLCLSAELRRRAGRFVSSGTVGGELKRLESAFPVLVARAKETLGLEQITRVLRKLASEEISIRNLRAILEHLLEFDYIRCDSARLIVLDDRMPTKRRPDEAWLHDARTLADFVRTRLKRYISSKHTRGGATLAVYLLDPEIEELLAAHDSHRGELPDADRACVFAAIAREVPSPLSSPLRPVLLTSVELRSPLRRLIQTRFPHLPVLCFQELSPDSSILPKGKITP